MSTPDSFWNHPIAKLKKALQIRKQIATLQDALGKAFGGSTQPAAKGRKSSSKRKGKRTVSKEAPVKIVVAQKARGAKTKKPVPAKAAPRVKAKGRKSPSVPLPAKTAPKAKKKSGAIAPAGLTPIKAAPKARGARASKKTSKQIAGRKMIAAEGQPVFRVL